MAVARRVYLYLIAFVALGMLLTGLAGLLEVGLEALAERLAPPAATVGEPDFRGRVSFSGAIAAIGLVAWLAHWWLAERSVRRDAAAGAERGSAIRKLFLYAVLLVGGLILTFALADLLGDLLLGLFGRLTSSDLITGELLGPISLLLAAGPIWLYHTRVAAADRAQQAEFGAGATLRRWFAYSLAYVALLLFLFNAAGLVGDLWRHAITPPDAAVLGGDGLAFEVAGRLGSLAAGLAVWLLVWRWSSRWLAVAEPDPEARSVLRKVYVYLVLALAVAWTVWSLGQILYGLFRLLLIRDDVQTGWTGILRDLGEPVATALVFGLAWLYHAGVVRREAALLGEERQQASIRWLYEYLVSLVALVAFAVGLGGTLATLLDLLLQPGAVRPVNWWQEQISLFATLAAAGLPLWLLYWGALQREAAGALARGSLVRRVYLFVAFALAVLTLLTSGAYALYQLIRLALGELWTPGQTTDMLSAASASAVAALLLVYHLGVFRRDAAAAEEPVGEPVLAFMLVRAPSRETLAALRQRLSRQSGVEVELHETDLATAERLRALARSAPD